MARTFRTATSLIGLLALTGPVLATQARYACADGTRLTATFSAPGAAHGSVDLVFAGTLQKAVLPQVLSADGGRYAAAETEFWIKGRTATLTRAGVPTTCRAE
jgi:membrane-bound inhibitor of C-type lysozyme